MKHPFFKRIPLAQYLVILALSGFSQLEGSEGDPLLNAPKSRGLNKSEVRAAAFVPTSQTLREVYGDVLPSIQIEQAKIFKGVPNLELWGNLEWIFSHGEGEHSCGSSHIDILNISLGAKGIGPVYQNWIFLYGGIGPDLAFTWIKNQSSCCIDCDERQGSFNRNIGIGGIVKSGCQIFFARHFFLDFFLDYLYLPMHYHTTRDIGGLKAGIGISGQY